MRQRYRENKMRKRIFNIVRATQVGNNKLYYAYIHILNYRSILYNDNELCPDLIMFPTALMLQSYNQTEVW
jgi:hypothetical protein